jgi:hypothetical protein
LFKGDVQIHDGSCRDNQLTHCMADGTDISPSILPRGQAAERHNQGE